MICLLRGKSEQLVLEQGTVDFSWPLPARRGMYLFYKYFLYLPQDRRAAGSAQEKLPKPWVIHLGNEFSGGFIFPAVQDDVFCCNVGRTKLVSCAVRCCAENEIESILCFCYCGGHAWEQVCLQADRSGFEAMTIYILPFGFCCAVCQWNVVKVFGQWGEGSSLDTRKVDQILAAVKSLRAREMSWNFAACQLLCCKSLWLTFAKQNVNARNSKAFCAEVTFCLSAFLEQAQKSWFPRRIPSLKQWAVPLGTVWGEKLTQVKHKIISIFIPVQMLSCGCQGCQI